jgi:ferredoxin, 2Fe-2S
MAKVTYIQPDGSARTCVNFEGMTVMQCGTCHCYIAPEWTDRVGPPSPDEAAMLEALDGVEVRPTSRLSCQIQLSEELDGLVVEVPLDQPGI